MRKIYITVVLILLLALSLFVATFVYLDRSNHQTYEYTVTIEGKLAGNIRLDKFITEERLIYKSESDTPFYPKYTKSRERIDLDRRYALQEFLREDIAGKVTDLTYLQDIDSQVSFLSTVGPKFIYVDKIPVRRDTFVFEPDSPVTYMPIIENYDFSRGRSQGFNTLTFPDQPDPGLRPARLPPMKRFITLTSIKDEYLKIDSRKIKTENLLLKTRNYPNGSIWVAKSDRALIKIDLPSLGIVITRSFRNKKAVALQRTMQDPRYMAQEVSFKSAGAELSGTLTTPTKDGKFPAVLLIGSISGPDRDLKGTFATVADWLSKNGYSTLRFDKRGTGSSKGDASSSDHSEDLLDAASALGYLRKQPNIDADKIIIIAHGEAAYPAIRLSSDDSVKGVILMSPLLDLSGSQSKRAEEIGRAAARYRWPDEYLQLVMRAESATKEKVETAKGDWIQLMGRRVFVNANRQDLFDDNDHLLTKMRTPILILQGTSDGPSASFAAGSIDKAISEAKDVSHAIKYFSYLGNLLAVPTNDGVHKIYYETDSEVLKNVREWIDNVIAGSSTPVDTLKPGTEGVAVTVKD